MRAMASQTAGPIKTKLGMGTHVDPGSVLVTSCRLAKAKKITEARKGRENRGPHGRDNSVWRTAEARRAERIEFPPAWRKPIKPFTEARKGRENRGLQRRDNSVRRTAEARRAETIEFGAAWRMLIKLLQRPRPARAERIEARMAETTLSGGWVLTASII